MSGIVSAFVLAAGIGSRMRPLTVSLPKPLVQVGGRPLIEHALDRLRAAGVKRAVVNVHHLAEQVEAWCRTVEVPQITISDERDLLLDTGGGIARALPLLGCDPFYVMNSDSFWIDRSPAALDRLRMAWVDKDMDCLLLLCDPAQTTGYGGGGDFVFREGGRIARRSEFPERRAFAYIGGYLVHPRLFANAPPGAFSMNVLWDRAIATDRLFGLAHDGHWLHVGTVAAIAEAEEHLRRM